MTKTALIVDDSPLARHVLSQVLAEHDLTADTAPSAEAALEYLKQRRPDVIFMDHLMAGMDGFEALEAIKANPATATIPVMMYTSQEGELYVGQARALGAFGVLPKDLKPVEVARVLKALHLIPGPAGDAADERAPRAGLTSPADSTDSHRVKELLEELFYQQRSALREEIRESYQRALASTHTQLKAVLPPPPPPRRAPSLFGIAAAALALLAATFAYLYFNTNRLLEQTTERSTALIASSAQLSAASAQALDAQAPAAPAAAVDASLLDVVEWAMNLAGGYAFDGIPLDDARAQTIGTLVQFLERAGFRGIVAIEVHVGRFCMDFEPDGSPALAVPEQPAAQCAQIGWPTAESVALGRRQTLTFANTVATATNDTGIRVQTASAGSNRPLIEYPPLTSYVTAQEWNAAAASNHRIELSFIADAGSYLSRSAPRP